MVEALHPLRQTDREKKRSDADTRREALPYRYSGGSRYLEHSLADGLSSGIKRCPTCPTHVCFWDSPSLCELVHDFSVNLDVDEVENNNAPKQYHEAAHHSKPRQGKSCWRVHHTTRVRAR